VERSSLASHAGVITAVAFGLIVTNVAPAVIGGLISGAHVSETVAANLVTAEWMAIAVASLILSTRVQFVSLRNLGIMGLVLTGLAQLTSAAFEPVGAKALICFYGLRIVTGLGEGMLLCAANASIAHLADPARAYAIATVVAGLCAAVFLAAVPVLQAQWPPAGFALLAGIAFLALPLLRRLEDPVARDESSGARSTRLSAPAKFGLNAVFLFSIALGALWSFSEVIGTRLGLSRQQADHVLALNLLAGLVGGLSVAAFNDRWGYLIPVVLSMTCLAAAAVILGVTQRTPVYVATQLAYGLAYPVALSFLMAAIANLDRSGRLLSACGGITLLGFAFGPSLGGFVVAQAGIRPLGLCVGVVLVLSVGCIAAASRPETVDR
jgi:predicted MFS family arabinose efflux permease